MRTFKTLTLLALLVVVSAFAVNVVVKKETNGYAIGDKAADFYLRNIDGQMMSLKDIKNTKGFVIAFTCNTCPFSVANEDRLIAIDAKYKSLGYPVIAINPNDPLVQPGDSFKAMQQRAAQKGFTFPYLEDNKQEVFPKYGATKTPHIYVVQKNSKDALIVKYIGAIDNSSRDPEAVTETYLEDALDALLSGKKIKITETRAIGCSIKG